MQCFYLTYEKPTKREAARRKATARRHRCYYVEVNRVSDDCPAINNGNFMAWFESDHLYTETHEAVLSELGLNVKSP